MTRSIRFAGWCLAGSLAFLLNARAYEEAIQPDSVIFDEAKIVVVAQVKPGSLQNTEYGTKATLQVSQVLKGGFVPSEISVVLCSGALPIPGRIVRGLDGPVVGVVKPGDQMPYFYDFAEPIRLYDGNPDGGHGRVIDDIRGPNIWFLRTDRQNWQGDLLPKGALDVLDYPDVQPMSKLGEFELMMLSTHFRRFDLFDAVACVGLAGYVVFVWRRRCRPGK